MLGVNAPGATLAAPRCVAAGDLVVVYMAHDNMKAVKVTPGGWHNGPFGNFKLADWIGKPYGSRVYSKQGSWVILLAPTPELWTRVLSHRTQILYVSDIAQICAGLELRPGMTVRFHQCFWQRRRRRRRGGGGGSSGSGSGSPVIMWSDAHAALPSVFSLESPASGAQHFEVG